MVAGSYMHGGKSIGGKGGSMNLQGQSANAAANMNNLRLRNLKGGKLLNESCCKRWRYIHQALFYNS